MTLSLALSLTSSLTLSCSDVDTGGPFQVLLACSKFVAYPRSFGRRIGCTVSGVLCRVYCVGL